MKFLHTSDLHIGKKLDGSILRLDEQKDALWEIADIAKKESVDIILIAGDIFDTYMPSSDAENLFFEFVNYLSDLGLTAVCISGNHDDADRLTAAKSLAEKRGVYLCGGNNRFSLGGKTEVKLIECGKNYLTFSKNGDEVFIATLPYFGEAPTGETVDREKEYGDRVGDIISDIFKNKKDGQKAILLTHLFMLGGEKTEGERNIDLGGVKVVSPLAIPSECDYTALGHLHKRQVVSKSKNAIYSGSPLQYSYDEEGLVKSVTVFSLSENGVEKLSEIPLRSGVELVKIKCEGVESVDEKLCKNADKFVDLTIVTDRPLTVDETSFIKSKYPKITKLKLEFKRNAESNEITERKNLSDEELFVLFYTVRTGNEPSEDIKRAYLEIMSEE